MRLLASRSSLGLPRLGLVLVALVGSLLQAQHGEIDENRILPSEHPAIDYWNADPDDVVARLQRRLDSGEVKLEFNGRFGYLPAVLKALDVPVSSQVLVFSKTSFQAVRIVPRIPRALYHNADVSVGWVRGGDVVEIASLDPKLGVVFYTLDQTPTLRPAFTLRTTECIACHTGPATLGVPGLMVRSVHPDRSGRPQRAPSFITDHRSPLKERWGGWYVSGNHGSQRHLGNVIYEGPSGVASPLIGDRSANVEDLDPYVTPYDYLRSTSDIVSLMVLEHQTRMTNLLTRLGYETRIALHEHSSAKSLDGLPEESGTAIKNTAEELVRYMLFADEAALEEPISGNPDYVRDFEAEGPRDSKGRSLRELRLDGRVMRYPCSFMIYSEAFDGLPGPAKEYAYRRLWDVLTGNDPSSEFEKLSGEDRRAVLEIVTDTKDDLPAYWAKGVQ